MNANKPRSDPAAQLFVARRLPDGTEEILAGPFVRAKHVQRALDEAIAAGHEDAYELCVGDFTRPD